LSDNGTDTDIQQENEIKDDTESFIIEKENIQPEQA
jgi:hypothetical protein